MPNPKVSVLIATYNRLPQLRRCLPALLRQSYTDFELVVADNSSNEDTKRFVEELAKEDRRLRLIKCQVRGVAAARNVAVTASRGEFVCFIDDDCLAPQDWIAQHLQHFQRPEIGGAGSPQLPVDDNLVDRYLVSRYLEENFQYFEISDPDSRMRLATCNACFRRKAFESAGGFDENFGLSGEDPELSRRILQKGFVLVKTPQPAVTHLKVQTFTSFIKTIAMRSSGSILEAMRYKTLNKYYFSPFITLEYLKKNLERYRLLVKRDVGFWEKMAITALSTARFYTSLVGNYYYYSRYRGRLPEPVIPVIRPVDQD